MATKGSIKSFNADKGFGFITGTDGSDVFCHIKSVVDGSVPQTGDVVNYDMEPSRSKPGQMTALNVSGGTGVAGGGGGKGANKGGPPTGTQTGQCKNFNSEKGFGFITAADGSDVFVHARAMVDGTTPQQGDWLTYDTIPSTNKPGEMQADNCTGGTGYKSQGGGKGGGYGGGYGASKGDSWGAPQGGKGSPYGGGKDSGWGGDSWSGGGGGGGGAWGGKGGDSWGASGGGGGGAAWGAAPAAGGDAWGASAGGW